MANPRIMLLALLALGVGACASAPAKAPTAASGPAPAGHDPTAGAQDMDVPAPATVSFVPSRKLGPGQCEECFDCVDTVGFPPAGHRWACVQGKCLKARLPGAASESAAADGNKSAEPDKPEASARKAKRRRR